MQKKLFENPKGWSLVGKVRDAHGLKGELFLIFFAKKADWLDRFKTLTLVRAEKNDDGTTQEWTYEFPVKRVKAHKVGCIVKVDGIENRTQAEGLAGSFMYVSNELLTSKPGENVYLREVEGFRVLHSETGDVGVISKFSSNGAQDLLVVQSEKGQFDIPFVTDFVEKIDWKNKQILMTFPTELMDYSTAP